MNDKPRYAVAIADLLTTSPWSFEDETGNIYVFGSYFVGNDAEPTFIQIKATQRKIDRLKYLGTEYIYQRLLIASIQTISMQQHKEAWEHADQYREMVLGTIDLNQDTPPEAKNPRG